MLERIYGGVRHMGRKGKFKERTRSNQRIREGVSKGYGRRGAVRAQRRNILTGRIARKIYGKEIIRMVRQVI